ncbi:serine proteinase stubble-like isoform X2 [Argiope bruennichi]|uniref:Serine proteinase stubble like protein n=1 Tax=Argiope bruennichi TaxID=94029 RepID=A0A8T0FMU1_ARGBR|nr:serine proteinase stubble-like isoform X2 [Argiope bruennichi]KAF8791538.1 Serine proteinase stubble like protein [Argiope bruennichi]
MEKLRKPAKSVLLSLVSLAFVLKPQVRSLQIRPQACYNSMGDGGTCMFVWECIKTEGKHLGTCADGFLFGSCCGHNDSKNNLIPQISTTSESYNSEQTTESPTTSVTQHGSLNKLKPSNKPELSGIFNTRPLYPQTTAASSQTKPQSEQQSKLPAKTTQRPAMKPTQATETPVVHFTRYPSSSVTTEKSLTLSTTSSSDDLTQKQSSSTNKFGNVSPNSTNGWFRPSAITSFYASTKGPQYSTTQRPQTHKPSTHLFISTKSSTTRRPQTTPKYRPSWKPSPGFTTPSKSHLFTFSNYYTTPKTTHLQVTSTTPYSSKNSSSTSKPVSLVKPTQRVSTTRKPNSTTYRPIFSTSEKTVRPTQRVSTTRKPSTTYRPIFGTNGHTVKPTQRVSTTRKSSTYTYRPIFSTSEKTPYSTVKPTTFSVSMIPFFTTYRPKPPGTTHFNWFSPPTTKLPVSTNKYNATIVNGSVLVESTVPSIIRPSSSIKPTGSIFSPSKPFISTSTERYSTTVSSKQSTPFPISPCGLQNPHPQKKVVGGKNSAFGSWPWQASVRRTSFFGFSSTHRCGGALISRQWVATAGHCVDDLLLSQIKIRVGEYDFASVQEPHGYVERGAKKKIVHPRYNFFTYENDLALVQLEEAIDSEKYPHISPICLPPVEESLVGKNATVTGWGRLSEGGILPSILQEVQVPIISNEKCKNMFLAAGRHEYIPDIFMCAGFEEGGRDSCQGDSGGPLQIQADEGYWFLAGIISWGIGCAEPNMPGVCTRISKFKDWVVQQIT